MKLHAHRRNDPNKKQETANAKWLVTTFQSVGIRQKQYKACQLQIMTRGDFFALMTLGVRSSPCGVTALAQQFSLHPHEIFREQICFPL